MKKIFIIVFIATLVIGCEDSTNRKTEMFANKKSGGYKEPKGIPADSAIMTRPGEILMTKHLPYRLNPIFYVEIDNDDKYYYYNYVSHYQSYDYYEQDENNWNHNFMPGFAALYGDKIVNVALFNYDNKIQKNLFEKPVLINTLYYPALSKDTLNSKPIERNYYMVSLYDEDTDKSKFINKHDLRRFYLFDIDGNFKTALIPKNYSVISSQYDMHNDIMNIYAILDENNNGKIDLTEPVHIFWINLKDPTKNGMLYKNTLRN